MVKLRKSYPSAELQSKAETPTGQTNGTSEGKLAHKRRKSDKIVYTAPETTEPETDASHLSKNGNAARGENKLTRKRRKSEVTADVNVVELEEDSVPVVYQNGNGTLDEESEHEAVNHLGKDKRRKKSDKVKPIKPATVDSDVDESKDKVDKIDKKNETAEEKLARRKAERKRRTSYNKGLKPGRSLPLPNILTKQFNLIWDRESKFVSQTLNVLPEVRRPHLFDDEEDKIEEYLLEEESAKVTEKKREKFLAKMKARQGGSEKTTRALTHEELKERLHAKIASLGQKRNEKKHQRKLKKQAMKKEEGEETPDKKKKFISKANPNLKNQQKGQQHNLALKDEKKPDEASSGSVLEKTPLRKKPVVKSNGEVVYSKFDFISAGTTTPASVMNGGMGGKKSKPKPEELLKTVQKTESKIARLETEGRSAEAVSVAETQKWDSALKRAQGEKIRDDPTLLKKTIKSQEKRKQVSKKKWVERTEHQQKLKEVKIEKRKANIQSRKDDKAKKVKKQQRKKGRAA